MEKAKTNNNSILTTFIVIISFLAMLFLRDNVYKVIFLAFIHEKPLLIFNHSSGFILYLFGALLISISIGFISYRFIHNQSKNRHYGYLSVLIGCILIIISCAQFKTVTFDTVYIISNIYTNKIERLQINDINIVSMDALSYWRQSGRRASNNHKCYLRVNITLYDKNQSYDMNTTTSGDIDEVYILNSLIPKSAKRYVNYTAGCELEMYRLELESNLGVPVDAN